MSGTGPCYCLRACNDSRPVTLCNSNFTGSPSIFSRMTSSDLDRHVGISLIRLLLLSPLGHIPAKPTKNTDANKINFLSLHSRLSSSEICRRRCIATSNKYDPSKIFKLAKFASKDYLDFFFLYILNWCRTRQKAIYFNMYLGTTQPPVLILE